MKIKKIKKKIINIKLIIQLKMKPTIKIWFKIIIFMTKKIKKK